MNRTAKCLNCQNERCCLVSNWARSERPARCGGRNTETIYDYVSNAAPRRADNDIGNNTEPNNDPKTTTRLAIVCWLRVAARPGAARSGSARLWCCKKNNRTLTITRKFFGKLWVLSNGNATLTQRERSNKRIRSWWSQDGQINGEVDSRFDKRVNEVTRCDAAPRRRTFT